MWKKFLTIGALINAFCSPTEGVRSPLNGADMTRKTSTDGMVPIINLVSSLHVMDMPLNAVKPSFAGAQSLQESPLFFQLDDSITTSFMHTVSHIGANNHNLHNFATFVQQQMATLFYHWNRCLASAFMVHESDPSNAEDDALLFTYEPNVKEQWFLKDIAAQTKKMSHELVSHSPDSMGLSQPKNQANDIEEVLNLCRIRANRLEEEFREVLWDYIWKKPFLRKEMEQWMNPQTNGALKPHNPFFLQFAPPRYVGTVTGRRIIKQLWKQHERQTKIIHQGSHPPLNPTTDPTKGL